MDLRCDRIVARVAFRIALLCVVWVADFVPAEDAVESSSVIPIARTSEGQVGSPIAVETLATGTSSRTVRKAAIDDFPVHLMAPTSASMARNVLDNLSLFRRLPQIQLEADRRCYEYFTNHPDVAVGVWRAMKISRVQMVKKAENVFETDTLDGTAGVVEVLLKTPEHYVVTCQGEFKSPAIKKAIQATAMMHLRPQFSPDGTVTHQLDMYVSFPSSAVETIARLISPISNRIADRNFEEISLFVEMMSLAMTRQPGWVEKIGQQIDGVDKNDTKELLKLTAEVYVDAVKAAREMGEEPLMPPMVKAAINPDDAAVVR